MCRVLEAEFVNPKGFHTSIQFWSDEAEAIAKRLCPHPQLWTQAAELELDHVSVGWDRSVENTVEWRHTRFLCHILKVECTPSARTVELRGSYLSILMLILLQGYTVEEYMTNITFTSIAA